MDERSLSAPPCRRSDWDPFLPLPCHQAGWCSCHFLKAWLAFQHHSQVIMYFLLSTRMGMYHIIRQESSSVQLHQPIIQGKAKSSRKC